MRPGDPAGWLSSRAPNRGPPRSAASATLYFVSASCFTSADVMPRSLRTLARSYVARASSRFAIAVLTVAVSSSGGGGSLALSGPRMPSWARVWRSDASARSRASASSFVSSRTSGVPTFTSRADFNEHLADNACGLGADLGLVGRQEGARQVDLPLDGHPQHRRRVDRDGLGGPCLPLVCRAPASARQHRRHHEGSSGRKPGLQASGDQEDALCLLGFR